MANHDLLHDAIQVDSTTVTVARVTENLVLALVHPEHRDIKRPPTQIVHEKRLVLHLLVVSIRNRSSGRLVQHR